MRFANTDEHQTLRAEARRFLSERATLRAQIGMLGAHDPALWQELASLGWLGTLIPEEFGGHGLGFTELAILLEECGRALLPGPLLSSVIGGGLHVDLCGTDEQRARILPRIADGSWIVGFTDGEGLAIDGDHVRGEFDYVHMAGVADALVIGHGDQPPVLLTRDAFVAEPMEWVDLTRPRFHVRFDGTGERMARNADAAWTVRATVAAAAESAGAAAGALHIAVEHAKQREQFGKPIGSFQAIKHKAADMLRAVEAAHLAVAYAAYAIDAGAADVAVAAATAKALASDALLLCATENIQIHGGIGFTFEHDAHLYYRRALSAHRMFGTPESHREAVARALLDGDAFTERGA